LPTADWQFSETARDFPGEVIDEPLINRQSAIGNRKLKMI